jgi:uncharacterized protein (DUF1697 family)
MAANTFVALLRGINVGGNNMVPMKSLKASFERLGFEDVSTYIASGNVLFRTAERDPRKLEATIDPMLARDYGLKGKTVVRSQPEMARLVRKIGRTWDGDPAWRYNVIFLRHTIDSRSILADLSPKPDIEHVVYCPGTLLWSARVDSLTRTTMLKLASRPMYQEMTIRNVNTTTKILELMQRMAGL